MGWRRAIEARYREAKVGGKWFTISWVVGSVLALAAFAFLPAAVACLVLAVAAVLVAAVDVAIRRRPPGG